MPKQPRPRYIVYEQSLHGAKEVWDCFGIFYSWERANKLCKKLQAEHPQEWYGIRTLLTGNTWLKEG